jgi:hypothetical protein
MKRFALLVFLVTIINPYEDISCYECITVYNLKSEPSYRIKVYGPEKDSNETEFTDAETERFIKKVDAILNYSPYVFQSPE